jgi:hypothetical protein
MADPNNVDRVAWIKSFAKMIRPYCPSQYIAATDVGTTELDMAVFAHEVGDMRACTGKPAELGGIPHELGTTGYGVSVAFKVSLDLLKVRKLKAIESIEMSSNNKLPKEEITQLIDALIDDHNIKDILVKSICVHSSENKSIIQAATPFNGTKNNNLEIDCSQQVQSF